MSITDEIIERGAAKRGPTAQPLLQTETLPGPIAQIQMIPQAIQLGVSNDGRKVLQFIQGNAIVTVVLEEELRKAAVQGLTGIILANGGDVGAR